MVVMATPVRVRKCRTGKCNLRRTSLQYGLVRVGTKKKPITHALTSSTDNRSPRQTRHLSFISEFTSNIRHIKGKRNVVADALSRPPSLSVPKVPPITVSRPSINSATFPDVPAIDFEAFAGDQDPTELLATSSLSLKQVPFKGFHMWCDFAHNPQRP